MKVPFNVQIPLIGDGTDTASFDLRDLPQTKDLPMPVGADTPVATSGLSGSTAAVALDRHIVTVTFSGNTTLGASGTVNLILFF